MAHRSGSFEKHGIKVLPIFMRGGREAVQALISRDVFIEVQGSSGVISAWAQGAKDLVAIGATGNKLDYVFVSGPAIKKPADLKGKKSPLVSLAPAPIYRPLGSPAARFQRERRCDSGSVLRENDGRRSPVAMSTLRFFNRRSLYARANAGFPIWVDFSKTDYEYVVAGPVTTRSFISSDRETVINFMRGLADGMDFYRDEKNQDAVLKYLGEFYKSNNTEELDETRRCTRRFRPACR